MAAAAAVLRSAAAAVLAAAAAGVQGLVARMAGLRSSSMAATSFVAGVGAGVVRCITRSATPTLLLAEVLSMALRVMSTFWSSSSSSMGILGAAAAAGVLAGVLQDLRFPRAPVAGIPGVTMYCTEAIVEGSLSKKGTGSRMRMQQQQQLVVRHCGAAVAVCLPAAAAAAGAAGVIGASSARAGAAAA